MDNTNGSKPEGRGGAGRGQGRKPADGKRGTRRQIILDDASADTLRDLGDGDLSLGIRKAAAKLRAMFQFDEQEFSSEEMIEANGEDDELILFVKRANIGDTFCGCKRIA